MLHQSNATLGVARKGITMKTILAFAAAIAASAANATVIDSYNGTGPFTYGAPQTNAAIGSSSAGFARSLNSTASTYTKDSIDTTSFPGVWGHDQGKENKGVSMLSYNLGNFDLTDTGTSNALRVALDYVRVLGWDSGEDYGDLRIYVDGVGQSLGFEEIVNGFGDIVVGVAGPIYVDFLFSSFGGVDFTSVSKVDLYIDGKSADGLAVFVDMFGTAKSTLAANGSYIPEPITLALFGLGLAGLGAVRRKKLAA